MLQRVWTWLENLSQGSNQIKLKLRRSSPRLDWTQLDSNRALPPRRNEQRESADVEKCKFAISIRQLDKPQPQPRRSLWPCAAPSMPTSRVPLSNMRNQSKAALLTFLLLVATSQRQRSHTHMQWPLAQTIISQAIVNINQRHQYIIWSPSTGCS